MKRGEPVRTELTRAQQALARRVAESRATVPDLVLGVEFAAPDVDVVIHAAAAALREVPAVNAAYRDGAFERYDRVNVGIVVPTAEARSWCRRCSTPTPSPSTRSASSDWRSRPAALAGELTAPDLASGSFTVYAADVDWFQPVVVPGQAATLAVGRRQLVLVADHRIVLPHVGAAFLAAVQQTALG